jgi:predicted phage baseplate assembly protein
MNETKPENCNCCTGLETVTPEPVANRPGLPSLTYRMGTHATFLESMLARLSSLCLGSLEECRMGQGSYPLRALTTRSPADPAIAFLDAFATIGDVLTFYQERIANEGYLRTAVERRSVLELARLVGYRLRPGVAASVFLAYEMETGDPALIPQGARVQSTPGPDETAQTFETSADLSARYEWNNLQPRLTKPLKIGLTEGLTVNTLYFATPTTNLKPNDALLLIFDDQPTHQVLRRVLEAKADFNQAITVVTLQPVPVLVVLLVDLLQVAEAALAADLPTLKVDPDLSAFAPLVEWLILALKRVLENLRLGNYPQPLIGLTHDQIYTLLSTGSSAALAHRILLVGDPTTPVSAWDEDPFFVFLSQVAAKSRELIRVTRTVGADDPAQRFPKHLANVLTPVLERAGDLLATPSVRQHLACTIGELTAQGAPSNAAERQVLLESLGDQQQEGRYKFGRDLRNALVKLQSDDAVSQFAGLALGLLNQLTGLPWQPSAAAQARNTLDDLQRQMEGVLAHGEFDIRGIRRREFSPEIAQENLKALNRLMKAVPESKDLNCAPPGDKTTRLAEMIAPLSLPPASHPASPAFLARSPRLAFGANADAAPRMLLGFMPELREQFYTAWAAAQLPTELPALQAVHALRLTAAPFGYNAPQKIKIQTDVSDPDHTVSNTVPDSDWTTNETPQTVFTDSEYGGILPGSYLVIRKADSDLMAAKVVTTTARPRTDYSMSAKTTRLALTRAWWNNSDSMGTLRSTTLYGQSEALPLAPAPDPSPIQGAVIELEGLYNDLDSGRWLIVSGERADIPGVSGVWDAELVMLLGITQNSTAGPSGGSAATTRTTLTLSAPLSYAYKRTSVVIYGNVVKATQGETRSEVLGSGDGSRAFQQFALRQPPLTFVAAPTPSGTASTLQVRVNDLLWQEAAALIGLGPNQRSYLTRTDDAGVTTVTFGDGQRGARPPTGVENITALYRNGIGKGGNVRKSQISLMLTRPLHARSVTNPLPAAGGADPDSRDQARRNIPKSVAALDRLVSVRDYADFANTFAGIGKASAASLSDGQHRLVQVTVAGIEDIPITPDSDLFHSLYAALLAYGDPYQPVKLAVRELLLLVLSAEVSLQPEYTWEKVLPKLRAGLLAAFGFEQRELGQAVFLSQVIAVIQAVPGVAYVDVQALDALDRDTILQNLPDPTQPQKDDLATRLGLKPRDRIPVEIDRYQRDTRALLPAQIAYLTPDVPETLILNLRED